MWRIVALGAVLFAGGFAAASDVAAKPQSEPAPSKLDYLVFASLVDAPHLLTLASYRTIGAASAAKTPVVARHTAATALAD
jgi:hypothetical protein